jgi:hypothetical protein
MKKNIILPSAVLASGFIFGMASAQDFVECTPASNGILNGGACFTTPDELQVGFYRLALCESKPTFQNDGDCVFLLDRTTPITASVRIGQSTNLIPGPLSIPEGTYNYAMMLIDNEFGLRATFDFDSVRTDGQGNSGTTCWTNGNDILVSYDFPTDFPMTCGNPSEADARISKETLPAFMDDNDAWVNAIFDGETETTTWEATLLNSNLTIANVVTDPNNLSVLTGSDARYIWAVQAFKSPPQITSATSNIDLGFSIKDQMSIGFGLPPNTNHVEIVALLGFAFVVDTD